MKNKGDRILLSNSRTYDKDRSMRQNRVQKQIDAWQKPLQ